MLTASVEQSGECLGVAGKTTVWEVAGQLVAADVSHHGAMDRHMSGAAKGVSNSGAKRMLGVPAATGKAGRFTVAAVEWTGAHSIAEPLSATCIMKGGHRPMDVLHLSTARHLGLKHFLTFEANQKKLAAAEGFKVPL